MNLLIEPAIRKGCSLTLLDLESSSLTCSLLRVLLRTTYGKDPTVLPGPIADGYKQSLIHRKAIIELVKDIFCCTKLSAIF